jgi:cofilin
VLPFLASLLTSYKPKMIYSSTKEALKRVLTGVSTDDLQVNDASDLEENEVLKAVSKGKAAPK